MFKFVKFPLKVLLHSAANLMKNEQRASTEPHEINLLSLIKFPRYIAFVLSSEFVVGKLVEGTARWNVHSIS